MSVSTPLLVTFLVYILGMVLIGFVAYRSPKILMITSSVAAVWVAWSRHSLPVHPI